VASKFASLIGKRGYILAIAAVIAAVSGKAGVVIGFWDGPH
jgi:hypothetical protein